MILTIGSKTMRILISLIFLLLNSSLLSQDIYMEFATWKYSDQTRSLVTNLTVYDDEGNESYLSGVPLSYYIVSVDGEALLGAVNTDENGNAIMSFPEDHTFYSNEDGYMQFISRFEGSDVFNPSEEMIEVKDARVELEFGNVESERSIIYRGFYADQEGNEEPIVDQDIYLYVPRMFSLMKIEDGWLEEDGQGMMTFPDDLIGDEHGNIMVIARIEDHWEYGNLEASAEIDWALPKHSEKLQGPQRELWTPIAPLWMIITLIIMLAGVWGHYIYAFVQLWAIRKEGKRQTSE